MTSVSWLLAHSCLKDMLPDLLSNGTRPDLNLFFCFVFYAEQKGWDGNLWSCSACPSYVDYGYLFAKNLFPSCFQGRLEETACVREMGADNLLMCLSVLSS